MTYSKRSATVNNDVGAGHEGGSVGSQQHNGTGHLVVDAEAAQHGLACQLGIKLSIVLIVGIGEGAGGNRVDADAVLSEVKCKAAHHTKLTAL